MRQTKSPEFSLDRPLPSAAEVIRAIFTSPQQFYRGFSAEGPVREPVYFVLLVGAVAGTLSAVVTLVFGMIFGEVTPSILGYTVLQAFLFCALSPAIVGVIAAAYLLSIRTFVGKVANFREVYRMAAYAYGAMIVAWIPAVYALAITYMLMVLMGFGIRSVYRTSFLTAVVTVLVGFVPCGIGFILLRIAATLPFG
ncbi:MAG: YIP1 family protein [Actinomycetota bacterium]|nr:YIP1 family protein [Actinomycetota bacterium]